MTEQTELTRGQKIDKGDEVLREITIEHERLDSEFSEVASRIKAVLAMRARQLADLIGGFPTGPAALNSGEQLKDIEESKIINIDYLAISDLDDDAPNLFIRLNGSIESYELHFVNAIHSYLIDLSSCSKVDDVSLIRYAHPALKAIEDEVRRTQESWFGPRLDDEEE